MNKNIIRALHFSSEKHKNKRNDNDDFAYQMSRTLSVLNILVNEAECKDEDTIISAILYHVFENTDTSLREIEDEFGEGIVNIINQIIINKSISKRELEINTRSGYFCQARMVTLADIINNMRLLFVDPPKSWNEKLILGYFVFSKKLSDKLEITNPKLKEILDDLYKKRIRIKGKYYPVLPDSESEMDVLWDRYKNALEKHEKNKLNRDEELNELYKCHIGN